MAIKPTPTEKTVVLAGRDLVVRQVPMASTRRLKTMFKTLIEDIGLEAFDDVSKLDSKAVSDLIEKVVDKVAEFPYEILSIFIRKLDRSIFEDEENGVTFPEFFDALEAALEVNRLDALKNYFTIGR